MSNEVSARDPYRVLFPLGALVGIAGAGLWLLFNAQWIEFYPRYAHANLMFFGLMWSFVAGFLMTAIPKMTRTNPAGPLEISVAVTFPVLQVLVNVFNLSNASVALFGFQIVFLVTFVVTRFWVNKIVPFSGFVFLPAAFIQALLGCALYFADSEPRREIVVLLCGEAFLMNLVLGLGSRLIPVISRMPNALLPNEGSKADTWLLPLGVLVLLNVSYWIQLFYDVDLALPIRSIAVLTASVFLLKLFQKPTQWSAIGISLKAGVLFLMLGQFFTLANFGVSLAAIHLTYIGGFTLITVMISTRVMLAHGGQSLDYEVSSLRVATVAGLMGVSAVLRFIAGANFVSPAVTASIILFFVAFALWFHKFIKVLLDPAQSGV